VEQAFKVTVRRVNVQNYRGKNKRGRGRPSMTSDFKKAIVTLKAGDKIELVRLTAPFSNPHLSAMPLKIFRPLTPSSASRRSTAR
jgi:hypothetical protein